MSRRSIPSILNTFAHLAALISASTDTLAMGRLLQNANFGGKTGGKYDRRIRRSARAKVYDNKDRFGISPKAYHRHQVKMLSTIAQDA